MSDVREGVAAAAESQRIRHVILATPGARPCSGPGCLVITQGGEAGEASHMLTVHGIVRKDGKL